VLFAVGNNNGHGTLPVQLTLASNIPFGLAVFLSTLSVCFAYDTHVTGQMLMTVFKHTPHQVTAGMLGVESDVILIQGPCFV
jgi:hypothetical protein